MPSSNAFDLLILPIFQCTAGLVAACIAARIILDGFDALSALARRPKGGAALPRRSTSIAGRRPHVRTWHPSH